MGAQPIQAFWQAIFGMGIKEVKLETIEVEGQESTAIEVGKYILQGDKGQSLDEGKYIVIWKQESGRWKLYRDIFNSNKPAAS
jgi:ketosteroid isomerase-like protein